MAYLSLASLCHHNHLKKERKTGNIIKYGHQENIGKILKTSQQIQEIINQFLQTRKENGSENEDQP